VVETGGGIEKTFALTCRQVGTAAHATVAALLAAERAAPLLMDAMAELFGNCASIAEEHCLPFSCV